MAKVILTHEVTGLGAAGDVVDVKDGYARNYLLPRSLATPWTKGAEKQIAAMRKARQIRDISTIEAAQEVRDRLQSMPVVIQARAGATGRLFGTVTTAEIADAVKQAGGPDVDRRRIEVERHIKTVGDYQVKVKLHNEVTARMNLRVLPA